MPIRVVVAAAALLSATLVLLAPPGNAVAPNVNGRLVVVADYDAHTDIFLMDPDGTDRVNLTGENKAYVVYSPQASPDGTRIVYSRSDTDSNSDQIWVMDADATDKTQLTTGDLPQGGGAHPTWSPDGTRIAFTRAGDIWTMADDGTDQTRVADNDSWALSSPEWSPDGQTLAYVQNDQAAGSRIFTEPATGGAATARTPYNLSVRRPSWSPDGSTLLFWHNAGGVSGLYTMAPTGGTTTLVRAVPSNQLGAYAWSPEGDRIVFLSDEGGDRDVWIMDADGSDAVQVTPTADGFDHDWASWSADVTPPTSLPDQQEDVAMTPIQLPFTGDGPASYSVTAGVVPPGLGLASDGLLSGTPTDWGRYVFQVTATDGVTTQKTAYVMRVTDADLPEVAVNDPAGSTATSHPVTGSLVHTVRWTGVDATSGVATYDVRVRRAPWNGTFTAHSAPAAWQGRDDRSLDHTLSAGNTFCYSARASDLSGRTGAWSGEKCTVAPLADGALTRSSGWTRVTGSAYHGGSALSTKTRNATLTRTGARLARVGVIATTCPTCGVVDLFVGSTKIGRISLARGSSTLHRKPILLPRFTSRTGTVKVKVVSTGRLVRIDSLVVGAR